MAGRRPDASRRRCFELHQLMALQVHTIGPGPLCDRRVAVDQHPRTVSVSDFHHALREPGELLRRHFAFAHLDESHATFKCGLESVHEFLDPVLAGLGNGVQWRQVESAQYFFIRRQQRTDGQRLRPLPCQTLALAPVSCAVPATDTEKMQTYGFLRVGIHKRYPRRRRIELYAQLLVQLARQCRQRCFARLDLAAREFPVTGPRFTLRAFGEQHPAVGLPHDSGGDIDQHRGRM